MWKKKKMEGNITLNGILFYGNINKIICLFAGLVNCENNNKLQFKFFTKMEAHIFYFMSSLGYIELNIESPPRVVRNVNGKVRYRNRKKIGIDERATRRADHSKEGKGKLLVIIVYNCNFNFYLFKSSCDVLI